MGEIAEEVIFMKRKSRKKKAKAVSASELAQMGVCERMVVFEHRYGKRSTPIQRTAIRRGLKEHDRFYRDGIRITDKKRRCYIATLTLSPSSETTALRMFRDRILRPNTIGRWLIVMYYRTAPAICDVLERHPWLQPVARAILRPIAWAAGRASRGYGGNHDI
jgi:hypothetical protein